MAHPSKILIVDDEVHLRALLRKLVRINLGAPTVVEAADGPGAVALYKSERPDLVLLDINLIGSSGLEALGEIRAFDPEAVVVMLTAVDVRSAVEEATAKGASGYILKDTPHEEVAQALRDIVATVFGDATDAGKS